jgi:hypothetical protein
MSMAANTAGAVFALGIAGGIATGPGALWGIYAHHAGESGAADSASVVRHYQQELRKDTARMKDFTDGVSPACIRVLGGFGTNGHYTRKRQR